MTYTLETIVRIFRGSDGDATRALYEKLEQHGPAGAIAVNLLRASKNSSRAKAYRRGGKAAAYESKNWAMGNLCQILTTIGRPGSAAAGVTQWGWKTDAAQPFHRFVLFVDLSTGQVSFHSAQRLIGPDYPGEWDGKLNLQHDRIVRHVAGILAGRPIDATEGSAIPPTRWICDGDRHLVCVPYTVPGLHEMARALDIKPCWFHGGRWPHYDIPKGRHAEIAQRPDVQLVGTKELFRRIRDDVGRQIAEHDARAPVTEWRQAGLL